MLNELEKGPRNIQVYFSTTPAVKKKIDQWARDAQWTLSKTVHGVVVRGIRSFELEQKGEGEDER